MERYEPPFTITNRMLKSTASISEKLGRIETWRTLERQPHLRRNNRIQSVHASLKIEANSLSLDNVRDVLNDRIVVGPAKEIQEVKNAFAAYDQIETIAPYSLDDLLYNDFYFGGDATYIGYPTSSGVGSMMMLSSGFAMSSKCRDKDAAWAFLRTILSEEYQEDIWGMPINKNAFDKKLKEAMTVEYQKDADANGKERKLITDAYKAFVVKNQDALTAEGGVRSGKLKVWVELKRTLHAEIVE